jgi:hypothetical protein
MIRNLICVVTNACCCYYIEPKKAVERNVWVKSDFLTDNADFCYCFFGCSMFLSQCLCSNWNMTGIQGYSKWLSGF